VILDRRTRGHLARTTRFTDIREFERIPSTNTYLLGEARAGASEGVVAVADHQTQGRGRLGRAWTAPPGAALLVSVLLRPVGLPERRRHLVTAAVALAAARACADVAGFAPEIKWPNDLLVRDHKLAGILAEAEKEAVVVGLGLNVASAPPEAMAVDDVAGRPVDRGELLAAMLESLEGWYADLGSVAAAYREACATIGRRVRVELTAASFTGWAEGVDDGGNLLVRLEAGEVRQVSAGDVIHLRAE
jgi:BirA family biotin operon repressor/biotin-[acetyl-CoA-carboxylase] ligase